MTGPSSPPCFTPEEFDSWQAANAQCATRYRAGSPCEDCTREFAVEMRLLDLCTGRPPGPRLARATSGAPLAIPAIGLRQQVVVQ
jgi:hypothetical protein